MRLWTVHPLIVWERLQEVGSLCVDPAYYDSRYDGYIPWQYQWMACRVQERLPDYRGGFPWWAYCKKPDLRWVRHHRPGGQSQVRIELVVNAALAFPSWAWDIVHSGQFLSFTKREQEVWETAMRQDVTDEDVWPLPEPWRGELEASWLRLFDPALPAHGWADSDEKANPRWWWDQEAVFETLFMSDVRAVTHFVGKSRWSW